MSSGASGSNEALGHKTDLSETEKGLVNERPATSRSGSEKMLVNESSATKSRSDLNDLVYLVRGKDRGKSAWHYVLVDKEKRETFSAAVGFIDVADYGEILYSGWGEDPPQAIIDKIKEEFEL